MVNIFRRFQQPLLVTLTIVIIISFVVLYNLPNQTGNFAANEVGRVYGRAVTLGEAQRIARRLDVCMSLQLFEVLTSMVGRARSDADAEQNFLWNSLILRHEADALGINPTEADVEEAIRKLPVFQTSNTFDPQKYSMFLQNVLAPRGFNGSELEAVMADNLRLERLKELLGSTVAATPAEVRQEIERVFQKRQVSVVKLNFEDFKKAVQPSEEEVKKLFEQKKETLKTPEKRKVKFVAFKLENQATPLVGAERATAMEALLTQAQNFAQAMTAKDAKFEDVANAAKLKVQESPAFSVQDPPAELDRAGSVAQGAFLLTKEQPNSDVLGGPAGYYVLQLTGVEEARPLSYEEAKKDLTEEIQTDRAQQAMQAKATEVRAKIEAELKAGKTFAQAAEAAGMKAETLPPYSGREQLPRGPESMAIMEAGAELKEGELSPYTPTGTGGVLVHVDKLLPVEEETVKAQQETIVKALHRNKRESLFQEWLKARAEAAGLRTATAQA